MSVKDYRCNCCGLPLLMPCPYCKMPLDLSLGPADDMMGWTPAAVTGTQMNCLIVHENHKLFKMALEERKRRRQEPPEPVMVWDIGTKHEWWEDVRKGCTA